MRSSFLFIALIVLCAPILASAQEGEPSEECARGIPQGCWEVRFGNCAHENPRVAIPACTRRLVGELRFFRGDSVVGGNKRSDQAQFYALRGNAFYREGNLDRALDDYRLAIKSSRDVYWIFANRGSALFEAGDYQAALESFDEAVQLAPNDSVVLNARARLLAVAPDAQIRNGAQAITDARKAIGLEASVPPFFFDTLAAAYAENGDFENAREIQQGAMRFLPSGDQAVIDDFRSRLDLYEQNRPFRIAP